MNIILDLINELKEQLHCEDDLLAEIMKLSLSEYQEKLTTNEFSFQEVCCLLNTYNIDLGNFLAGTVNYKLIHRNWLSPSLGIPSQYIQNGDRPIHQVQLIVQFVSDKFNQNTADIMLNKFHINAKALLNKRLRVNVKLIDALINYLFEHLGFHYSDLKQISMYSFSNDCNSELMQMVSETSVQDIKSPK